MKKPKELLKFMEENIEYGFCDKDGNKYRESDKDFNIICDKKWRLSSPSRLLENKIGICWDLVELERDWFLRNNYNIKTIFIMFFNTNLPTHTFLAYEFNKKWYWFEYSDFNNRGIHKFDTYMELIKSQKEKHVEYVSKFFHLTDELLDSLHIIEYDKPNYDIDGMSFINYIVDYGKDITDIVSKNNVKNM